MQWKFPQMFNFFYKDNKLYYSSRLTGFVGVMDKIHNIIERNVQQGRWKGSWQRDYLNTACFGGLLMRSEQDILMCRLLI